MGTNFYRIPTEEEVLEKKNILEAAIKDLKIDPSSINDEFRSIENPKDSWSLLSPWDEFVDGMRVHLGKRSYGWKFCWNWNEEKYYKSKEELTKFVLSGRVVDEYGTEIGAEDFLEMAFTWGYPDGLIVDEEYFRTKETLSYFNSPKYYDKIIDGLRVSPSSEFS